MEAVALLRLWWMRVSLGSLATHYWIRDFSDRIISQSWCFSEQLPSPFPPIYSLWYNSRLQQKPVVIHRGVHHPTCCLSPHLWLSLSLLSLSAAVSLSCSLRLMLSLTGWLLILSHWFSLRSPVSPHLFAEWLTFSWSFFLTVFFSSFIPPASMFCRKIITHWLCIAKNPLILRWEDFF